MLFFFNFTSQLLCFVNIKNLSVFLSLSYFTMFHCISIPNTLNLNLVYFVSLLPFFYIYQYLLITFIFLIYKFSNIIQFISWKRIPIYIKIKIIDWNLTRFQSIDWMQSFTFALPIGPLKPQKKELIFILWFEKFWRTIQNLLPIPNLFLVLKLGQN